MEAGKFDVIDTLFFNEERARKFDFSAPYIDIEVPIYFQNNISGLTDAYSLKGFQVGVKSQDNAINYLQSFGIDKFLIFNSYESIIKAARDRQVLVFVIDRPPAEYFISKYGIQDNFNSSSALYTGQFHRAVKKAIQNCSV
jgi:ABC-type amino acid transport substrate-binding protein